MRALAEQQSLKLRIEKPWVVKRRSGTTNTDGGGPVSLRLVTCCSRNFEVHVLEQ